MKTITTDQAMACMQHGEFGSDILLSAERVAVVLTQSWCPQWLAMKEFLGNAADCAVYCLEYDKTDYFDTFRDFKENVFKNDQIPYIRYYRNGRLIRESNAVPQGEFHAALGL